MRQAGSPQIPARVVVIKLTSPIAELITSDATQVGLASSSATSLSIDVNTLVLKRIDFGKVISGARARACVHVYHEISRHCSVVSRPMCGARAVTPSKSRPRLFPLRRIGEAHGVRPDRRRLPVRGSAG